MSICSGCFVVVCSRGLVVVSTDSASSSTFDAGMEDLSSSSLSEVSRRSDMLDSPARFCA